MKPCIVVVGYNRPDCLSNILKSISEAVYRDKDIPLVISLDKATNDCGCLKVAEEFGWKYGKKEIRTFSERQGLRNHIIQCGDLSERYGSVIILEDDLLVSPMFYEYASKALSFYENDPKVTGISLYSHSWNGYANRFFEPIKDGNQVYLGQFSITWGECWTRKWWSNFKTWYLGHQKLDKDNDSLPININHWPDTSWGKYFITYMVESDLYYVIPSISLSTNNSALGEHANYKDSSHQVPLLENLNYEYTFAKSEDLLRYDIFFENMNIASSCFSRYTTDGVSINLYGKKKLNNNRYILTTKRLPYKVVESFGLDLRPIEMNVIKRVSGSSIFLYDSRIKGKKPRNNSYDVLKYELRGVSILDSLKYCIKSVCFKASNKIKRKK